MRKRLFQLMLVAALVIGSTLVPNTGVTKASDNMGCYGWFDYVYKATGDMNFAYYHFQVCRGDAVAHRYTEIQQDESIVLTPDLTLDQPRFEPGNELILP